MAINWTLVGRQVEHAVGGIAGAEWTTASGASAQLAAIIAAGRQIEQNKDSMKQAEYDSLKLIQQRALNGILQTSAAISADVAQLAAIAAWEAVTGALKAAYPALALIP
jgi:hypothetical protein